MNAMTAPKYRVISGGKAAAPEVLADYKRRYRFGTGAESGIMEVFFRSAWGRT